MRSVLNENELDSGIQKRVGTFHNEIVEEVKAAVKANKVVVVGMAWNPLCKKARELLKEKSIDFKYIEYGSYTSQWKQRLAIKMWSGWPTYPQVFMDGKLVGGFTDLRVKLG